MGPRRPSWTAMIPSEPALTFLMTWPEDVPPATHDRCFATDRRDPMPAARRYWLVLSDPAVRP
jgi:hypothetical protein